MLKWGDARTRLGKRKSSDTRPDCLIQSVKAVRADSVISNTPGREAFCCATIARGSDALAVTDLMSGICVFADIA
jgi:hypothetical protein